MASTVAYDDVEVGTPLPRQSFPVRRVNLIMYAGASGDFNVIHWNERLAKAARVVTDWVGDPGAVLEYGVRFSSPVVVPDDDHGAEITVGGTVTDKLDGGRVVVTLDARVGETKVLNAARATVQLS
jgi:acyl dehydratase